MNVPTSFLSLPIELREIVYDHLVVSRSTIKPWEDSYSQPRKCLESRRGADIVSWENWWPQDNWWPTQSDRWLSSMISLQHAAAMMQTCKQIHIELSSFVYQRLIWHIRVGRYSVPALPLQICPSYTQYVNHFSLYLHHGNSLDGILEGTDHVYIKFSSFWRNIQTFCKLAASLGKLRSIQIDTLLPSDAAVVDVMDAMAPLYGHVNELKIGRLGYEIYDRATFRCERYLSNAGYQRLREIFKDGVDFSFPFVDAQYKD